VRVLLLTALLALLAACANSTPLPGVTASPNPDDPKAPVGDRPNRPVMAGTVHHGIGDRP
jgi:hypothetical protein